MSNGDSNSASGNIHVLDVVSRYFSVLSSLLVLTAVASATSFLYAYLGVFDWRLIWLIEYSDVLTIGLIGLAFISGFSFAVWAIADDAYMWTRDSKRFRRGILGVAVIWVISLAIHLYEDYNSAQPLYRLHLSLHASIFALIALSLLVARTTKEFPRFQMRRLIGDVVVVVAATSLLGSTLGVYNRDTEGFLRNVVLKSGELRGVGIVMITSRHLVLFGRDTVTVVPADDLVKIERTISRK